MTQRLGRTWKSGRPGLLCTGFGACCTTCTGTLGVPDAVYRIMQIGSDAHMFVQDASYLRLRETSLYYSM